MYFILEHKTVSRPNFASHCSGVSQLPHLIPLPYALQPVAVWSKWGFNKLQFSLVAEAVSRTYHASHIRGVTQMSQFLLPPYVLQQTDV